MTATAPAAPQPTPEQLTAYADQLPDLYKDILAAIQYAQPSRVRGQGVLEGTLRIFIYNRRADRDLTIATDTAIPFPKMRRGQSTCQGGLPLIRYRACPIRDARGGIPTATPSRSNLIARSGS